MEEIKKKEVRETAAKLIKKAEDELKSIENQLNILQGERLRASRRLIAYTRIKDKSILGTEKSLREARVELKMIKSI